MKGVGQRIPVEETRAEDVDMEGGDTTAGASEVAGLEMEL